jgi:uncharacterized membrane protein YheB (UPF0754 family)
MPTLFACGAIPVVSALIGWLTNRLAVRMIFRPRRPVRVLWFRLVGLIPKRKAELARTIGKTVEKELISHHDIHRVVTSGRFQEEILDTIIVQVEDFIYVNLGSSPLVAMALSGEAAARIKQVVRRELRKVLPGVIEELFEKVESRLDFKEIIRDKIEAFDMSKLESIVYTIAARELKAIEMIGGVLGFIIGLGQVALLVLMQRT